MPNVKSITQKPHLHQDWIDAHALGIVKALQRHGHTTYLVGGCVRDLLLGILPKDFDIATDARPDEVKRIIYRSFIIGKRFRLVLVRRDDSQYEVATFRRETPAVVEPEVQLEGDALEGLELTTEKEELAAESGPAVTGDNTFGSPEEDAQRRDFTINGLFYDPVGEKLIDYTQGLPDLEQGWIRMIGEPERRLAEDPIRILRALRLAHKIGFSIEPSLRAAMAKLAPNLPQTVLPRRREEFLKLLRLRDPALAFLEAYDLGILQYLAPTLHKEFEDPEKRAQLSDRLSHFHDRSVNREDTAELFGLFVFELMRVSFAPDPNENPRSRDLLEDGPLMRLMRDELGMFKSEQSLLTSALQIESLLSRRRDFEKRGERRQAALVGNEAFSLALQFAERDLLLSPSDLHFWQERYWNYIERRPRSNGDRAEFGRAGSYRGGRRRRRRRPRNNRTPLGP